MHGVTLDNCRSFCDGPLPGPTNMAVDEVLLVALPGMDLSPTLRFYQWAQPTLSLGYFQRFADRLSHRSSVQCPIVRRSTGGGAILHDSELTYSFTTIVENRSKSDVGQLYDAFHQTLIEALAEFRVSASLSDAVSNSDKFLCFQRRAIGDVLVEGMKIGGSAQRRNRGRLLQHGSVLLRQSHAAPELPGIAELAGREIHPMELTEAWSVKLEQRLNVQLVGAELTSREQQDCREIAKSRFQTDLWTKRR